MPEWLHQASALAAKGRPFVIVTVVSTRGSAPRDAGTRMLVTEQDTIGSIGGGSLEYQCIEAACRSLAGPAGEAVQRRKFVLGANCGQCCGGVVQVTFETVAGELPDWLRQCELQASSGTPFVLLSSTTDERRRVATLDTLHELPAAVRRQAKDALSSASAPVLLGDELLEVLGAQFMHIAVFGAGHVGSAVVDLLSRLDCRVQWIDSRESSLDVRLPANVVAIRTASPAAVVDDLRAGSRCLVMTHSHPLDLEICARVLRRDDLPFCGLIGSRSKKRRFVRELEARGLPATAVDRLVCPIGIDGIDGKSPVEIAIAVVAEQLRLQEKTAQSSAALRIIA